MISQFTDEHTHSKRLSELKRGNLAKIKRKCSMTDFDLAEITAFKNSWEDIVLLICTFHAIAVQNMWIDKNAPRNYLEKLKSMFKELHYVSDEKTLRKNGAAEKILYG